MKYLPCEIGKLRNLVEFQVERNKLTSLPPDIGFLKSLKIFGISGNALQKIPPQIGFLPSLKSLYIQNNGIIDPPPEFINETKKLRPLIQYLQDSVTGTKDYNVAKINIISQTLYKKDIIKVSIDKHKNKNLR